MADRATSLLPRLVRASVAALGDEELVSPTAWLDAHTHIGQNDPDGHTATAEEILAGLDAAGHGRALTFAMHEPDGYRDANDAVLAACAGSRGRLLPLARVAPLASGALDEAERCLNAGARGFKLHPRSDAFALTDPAVEQLVAMAAERRMPVLVHAGRGIPELGVAAVDLAERYPGVRLILAHAAVSDLGRLAVPAARLPNLFFDTAWWHPGDLLQLFATVPSARILYASDMPYGPGLFSAFAVLRCARAVGLSVPAVRLVVGGQLARILDGDDPAEADPAPGSDVLGPRFLPGERVASYVAGAVQLGLAGAPFVEALELARSACLTAPGDPHAALLDQVAAVLADALREIQAQPEGEPDVGRLTELMIGALAAGYLATTPSAGPLPDL